MSEAMQANVSDLMIANDALSRRINELEGEIERLQKTIDAFIDAAMSDIDPDSSEPWCAVCKDEAFNEHIKAVLAVFPDADKSGTPKPLS